jgi:FKBP-type peptidyl-prolyl cis-trans isomerase 2
MLKEKLALIALIILVVGALSILLVVTYNEDIINNLFDIEEPTPVIEFGDAADVHYIGRYASNGSVFDTSYDYYENETGGTPLPVFVSMNKTIESPYPGYSQFLIDGMIEGLVGLEEGEKATIGPIPPEKAYGDSPLEIGHTFYTYNFFDPSLGQIINQTLEVQSFTGDEILVYWTNPQLGDTFTLPPAYLMEDLSSFYQIYEPLPPYYLWPNATAIVNITDSTVTVQIDPSGENRYTEELTAISWGTVFFTAFPDVTTVEWNDTTVTMRSTPVNGSNYTLMSNGAEVLFNVSNVTATGFTLTAYFEGQEYPFPMNNTLSFNRTYALRRLYTIPQSFSLLIEQDIQREGYSLNPLAGETLLFDVTIVKVYKPGDMSEE